MLKDRATTPESKRAVVERILRAWLAAPDLRFGQLLVAACEHRAEPVDPFHVEDEPLANLAEEMSPPSPHDLTPSEVAIARTLRAIDEWPNAEDDRVADILIDICEPLHRDGWLTDAGGISPMAAALLDRAGKAGVL